MLERKEIGAIKLFLPLDLPFLHKHLDHVKTREHSLLYITLSMNLLLLNVYGYRKNRKFLAT